MYIHDNSVHRKQVILEYLSCILREICRLVCIVVRVLVATLSGLGSKPVKNATALYRAKKRERERNIKKESAIYKFITLFMNKISIIVKILSNISKYISTAFLRIKTNSFNICTLV